MKTITTLTLAALMFGTSVLTAQDEPRREGSRSRTTGEKTISIKFTGGTLAEFLAQLRDENPWVNIVSSPEAKLVKLPAMHIKDAQVYHTLRAVSSIVTSDSSVRVGMEGGRGDKPVHSVTVHTKVRRSPRQVQAAQVRTQVFSLRMLTRAQYGGIEPMKTETILTAIDTGLGVERGMGRATIKYHADSGLLFIRGTADQISLVASTLSELRNDMMRSRPSQKPRRRGGGPTTPGVDPTNKRKN